MTGAGEDSHSERNREGLSRKELIELLDFTSRGAANHWPIELLPIPAAMAMTYRGSELEAATEGIEGRENWDRIPLERLIKVEPLSETALLLHFSGDRGEPGEQHLMRIGEYAGGSSQRGFDLHPPEGFEEGRYNWTRARARGKVNYSITGSFEAHFGNSRTINNLAESAQKVLEEGDLWWLALSDLADGGGHIKLELDAASIIMEEVP